MFMHISPVPDMWIFYASIIRHSSTAILSIFNEKATKHAVSEIYGKYSRKFVVHIIHIFHIFVWKVKGQNTLFSFEKSCAIMQVT